MAETIDNPSPDPGRPDAPAPRQNRSNSRSRSAGAGPGPSSRTVTSADPSDRDTEIVTRPSSGPCTNAFSTRFSTARASALSIAAHEHVIEAHGPDPVAILTRVCAEDSTHDLPQVDLPAGGHPGVDPFEGQQIVDEPGQPARVALELFEHLGVGPVTGGELDVPEQRGHRGPELVRGVREESPLAGAGGLERRAASG